MCKILWERWRLWLHRSDDVNKRSHFHRVIMAASAAGQSHWFDCVLWASLLCDEWSIGCWMLTNNTIFHVKVHCVPHARVVWFLKQWTAALNRRPKQDSSLHNRAFQLMTYPQTWWWVCGPLPGMGSCSRNGYSSHLGTGICPHLWSTVATNQFH